MGNKVGQVFGEAIPLELACQFQIKDFNFSQTGKFDPPPFDAWRKKAAPLAQGEQPSSSLDK
jgi:hypothetical protein